jgi:leader peptidase (prepilin peptidase) / N-methyltransferase
MFTLGSEGRDLSAVALAFLILFGALAAPTLWSSSGHDFVAPSLLLASALAVLSAIDLRQFRLPDAITLPLAAAGLVISAWSGMHPLWWSALSAVIGFALLAGVAVAYRYLRGRAGLGLGDAKLLAAAGAWIGAEALPTVLLWATGLALTAALLAYLRGQDVSGATRLPFGPFLASATWLAWLYGPL